MAPSAKTFLIPSKRSGKLLVHESFVYNRHSSNKGRTYWVCEKKPLCSARATTTDNPLTVVRTSKEHAHLADPDDVKARLIYSEIKQAGLAHPEKAPTQIIESKTNELSDEIKAHLPLRTAMKRTVNRVRQAQLPQNPRSLEDLPSLPAEFRMTNKGETFLLYDSYDEDEDETARILVFATRENLRNLAFCKTWFSDGTFKVCPSLFTQLFTTHGLYNEEVAFPFVYALLPNKEQSSYTKVFQVVRYKCDYFNTPLPEPETFITDFELAIVNSITAIYPHSDIRLCFSHLGQSAFRAIQEDGLQVAYSDPENREMKTGVHQILSLAFVPVEDVEDAFDSLLDVLPDELVDFAEKFEKTYVRGVRARGRRRATRPRYAPASWNQYMAAQLGEPRTNNICEAWHRRFNLAVNKHHPSLYSLLRELKKEQAATESMIGEIDQGRAVREPQRKKYREVTERLQRIALRYHEYKDANEVVKYLRRCGNTFCL